MDNTWIKLYRKTTVNGILKDHLAWVVFSWLLMKVDRETGKMTFGRFQMSDELGIKPNTLYSIIKRLEKKWGVIKTFNQKAFTEVWIVNWGKYQTTDKVDQTTIKSPSNDDNTKQEVRIENKENVENTKVSDKPSLLTLTKNQKESLKKKYPYVDLDRSILRFRTWQEANGREFPNIYKRFEQWLQEDEEKQGKITNAIIDDPIFKRLLPVYHAKIGSEWELKDSLIDRLNDKYPAYKFTKEWEEAKQVLKDSIPPTVMSSPYFEGRNSLVNKMAVN